MRRSKSHKPLHETIHWFCERCESILHSDLAFAQKQCHCGYWMEHVTEEELVELRSKLSFE